MPKLDHLKEVSTLFFKLGISAFGGPAAHIAMMEDEVVTKRKWMSREHFLDLVGATNLIPGPNSTEMAIHCGFHRAGWPGLIAAGVSFIFPACILTGVLAAFYVEFGQLPAVEPFFVGIRPVVLALILGAVMKLGQKAVKRFELGILGILVVIGVFLGLSEIAAILFGGILGMFWLQISKHIKGKKCLMVTPVFLFFLKIGMILFGSGYVLIAYLQGGLVEQLQWITQQELLDAVAIGQFTPGPVLSTATFIGYQIAGVGGAIAATVGIFLPSFVFVALLNPLIPMMRKSTWSAAFLDAVNVSAVGVMAAVLIKLAVSVLVGWKMFVIAAVGLIFVIFFKKLSSIWLVLLGSGLGYLFGLL
ncbi:MAG: chromate transporter [Candidatus Omnitrophica bacterium]|nr:chromate transporter [Candidatus Omnitrophota bacterium]